ncbi:hypothetical protein CBR_g51551 [Chara braunii]|uniref:CCHC-type domain-containing protein n=1 Tax=Chara braunii TaxID=69332 RepID=A0A388M8M7_CHABU|nr:hypothetical protein CBR_g51551 [Chara braunii]|eukprot:GBG90947.1 hypothetical protein CBR_g51551 [Chara braunii]
MKEVAAQLVTVVATLTEFVQGLQRQRIAAAQRQHAAMAAGAPMIRPTVVGAVPPLRCYNCNQPRHLAKDCPKPRTQGGPIGPSKILLAAPTAAGQGRVATIMDTGTTEMVTPAATEIGPDEYMAAAMFEPGTIGVIRHVQRITEESDLGPWRPGFEDLAVPVALDKSEFFLSEISFLGYIVTVDELKPDPRKVAAIQEAPTPVTLTQVWTFLGLASYYQRFIKGFAGVAKPPTNLLKKEEQLIWTPECEAAFQALKEALASAPVLARPDPTRPFALYTDWQPQAISAVLTQHGVDGREHVIEYASKTLSQAQANYEACKGECLAVVWGIQHFRPYLYGQKFVLVTGHQPLMSLRNNTDYTGTLGRWAVRLQDYDFDIRHRPTRQHGNADGLARLLPPNKCPANERLIPWRPEAATTKPHYGELHVLRSRMNHRQPEHETLEHFQTPLADRFLRHRFNEERQLRYDIQQVNVPAPGIADLAAYSLLCERLTYVGVYVDVMQLLGRETTGLTEGPYPMREFSEYLVELTDAEPLPFADEDVWELHRALYKSMALGMFRFFVDHEDQCIGEHFVVYYVITRPKQAEKEGTVALYPFAQLQTIDSGLLELIHLELLSIVQVIASEEEEIQPRLRAATAPRRTYNAVVISDYIAHRLERLEDFPEERPLRPPSSYPQPSPPKAPKKTPKRKRRHPSPGAQGSRIGGGEEVIQSARPRNPDPVPGSAATLVKEVVVPSPPFPRVPDLNLDGVGPSSSAAAGGGSRMGLSDPISSPRPNAMYHLLVSAAQKRERRPYTKTHVVMTGLGPRSVRKRVVRAVADLAPRVLSHVSGAFLYPSFVQHHFHEEDEPTTPVAMASFLPPIPPPLNPDIDHFL